MTQDVGLRAYQFTVRYASSARPRAGAAPAASKITPTHASRSPDAFAAHDGARPQFRPALRAAAAVDADERVVALSAVWRVPKSPAAQPRHEQEPGG